MVQKRNVPEARELHDDQVVPMHGKGNVIDFSKVDDSTYDMLGGPRPNDQQLTAQNDEPVSEDKLKVVNLPQSQRAYAEKLVPFIGGERIPCLMFQSVWKLREKGVGEFAAEMLNCLKTAQGMSTSPGEDPLDTSIGTSGLTHEQRCNQAILQNMTEVMNDTVKQVINKAFIMVQSYFDLIEKNSNLNPKQDSTVFEVFLMNLLDKLADSKVCQKATVCYERMFNIQ